MNYLKTAIEIQDNTKVVSEHIVGSLIKTFVLSGNKTEAISIFNKLQIKPTEELCEQSILLANSLGYSLSFSEFRGHSVAKLNFV